MSGVNGAFVVLDQRLENWGRWTRAGVGQGANRCASAEGRYRPRAADEDYAERQIAMVIDNDDAELVERAVLALPKDAQQFVQEVYHFNRHALELQRKFRCSRDQLMAYRVRCAMMVGSHLAESAPPLIRKGKKFWRGCIV